jgi:nucleotide-binding universal stress UspA family protein
MHAVKHAIQLAKGQDDARVNLLYVHHEPVRFGAVAPQVAPEQMKEIEQQATGSVFSEPEKLLREAGVGFEHEVRAARDVAPVIAKRAEELGCDAIVMGARGGGALAHMLLGSTATKVAHLAKVPVTLVK